MMIGITSTSLKRTRQRMRSRGEIWRRRGNSTNLGGPDSVRDFFHCFEFSWILPLRGKASSGNGVCLGKRGERVVDRNQRHNYRARCIPRNDGLHRRFFI